MSAIRPHSKRERRRAFQCLDIFGRFIGGDDDLLFIAVEIIESMEKFFLGGLLFL